MTSWKVMRKKYDMDHVTRMKSGYRSMIPKNNRRKREPCNYKELVVDTLMNTSYMAYGVGFHH